jgi:hypothetical protein
MGTSPDICLRSGRSGIGSPLVPRSIVIRRTISKNLVGFPFVVPAERNSLVQLPLEILCRLILPAQKQLGAVVVGRQLTEGGGAVLGDDIRRVQILLEQRSGGMNQAALVAVPLNQNLPARTPCSSAKQAQASCGPHGPAGYGP